MNLYNILLNTHSWLRWIFLIFMVITLANATLKLASKKGITEKQKKIGTVTLIIAHIQLLLGFILYFISPKVQFSMESLSSPILRFFTMEHIILMLIAISLLTIGNSKIKTIQDPLKASKKTIIWFSISLILILAAIPWPFRNLGADWL